MKLEDEQAAAWAATLSTETLRRVHGAPLTATNRQAIEAELVEREELERVARHQAAIHTARAALATISERVVHGTPTAAIEAETAALERLAGELKTIAYRLEEL